jgi:hypothetical protein
MMYLRRDRALQNDVVFESDVVHELFHVFQYAHTNSFVRSLGPGRRARACTPMVSGSSARSVAEVVQAGGNTWKRFPSPDGKRLEFCLLDPDEKVDKVVLAIANHAFDRSATSAVPRSVKGKMYLTADTQCGKWSGGLTYVLANLTR